MIITPIAAVDWERFQEMGLPGFGDSISKKREKINLGVIVHEKTAEKTMPMQICLTPICSVDPLHTLYSFYHSTANMFQLKLLSTAESQIPDY